MCDKLVVLPLTTLNEYEYRNSFKAMHNFKLHFAMLTV